MDFMDGVLSTQTASILVIELAQEGFGNKAAQSWLLGELDEASFEAGKVNWADQPCHSQIFAERLEALIAEGVVTSEKYGSELSALIYVPIMIRVFAGGEALAGERFIWEPTQRGGFQTVAKSGTDWEIAGTGNSWDITVARWDHADYTTSDLERAKRIAEQLEAASNVHQDDQEGITAVQLGY